MTDWTKKGYCGYCYQDHPNPCVDNETGKVLRISHRGRFPYDPDDYNLSYECYFGPEGCKEEVDTCDPETPWNCGFRNWHCGAHHDLIDERGLVHGKHTPMGYCTKECKIQEKV